MPRQLGLLIYLRYEFIQKKNSLLTFSQPSSTCTLTIIILLKMKKVIKWASPNYKVLTDGGCICYLPHYN